MEHERVECRHEVMYRPKKGFAVLLARWFRVPLLHPASDALRAGYFNPQTLRRIADEHFSGARDHSTPIWTLLMFDAFLRNVMTGSAASGTLDRAA